MTSADFCGVNCISLCRLSPNVRLSSHDGETFPQTSLSKLSNFHLIYLLHLHLQISDSIGLRFALQTHPSVPASYAVSVRQTETLPAASFRFHLTMDTLAVQLTIPTIKARWDLSSLSYLTCQAHNRKLLRSFTKYY